jgi:preprotein translocase subunit SecG
LLIYILYALFLLACVILVTAVLLQPGKADAGALFTSNISSTAFGPRGTQSVLAKITIGAAITFMLVAFLLSQPAITGNRSVLDTTAAPAESPAPATSPAASPAVSPEQAANANTAAVDGANTSNTNTATNANTTASPAK